MDCVFCSIVRGKAPASVVYEDEKSLAFLALHPINEGHALVIPKRHFVTLDDCDEDTASHLMRVLKVVNAMVCASVRCEGVLNEVMNGEAAGQEVFHLHLHVIPRYAGDEFGWTYREGYGERPALRADLDEVAARMRKHS